MKFGFPIEFHESTCLVQRKQFEWGTFHELVHGEVTLMNWAYFKVKTWRTPVGPSQRCALRMKTSSTRWQRWGSGRRSIWIHCCPMLPPSWYCFCSWMVVSDLDIGCMDAFNSTRFDEDRWLVFTKNPVLPVLGQSWSDNLGVQWCEAVKAQCHDFAQQNLDLLGVVRQMRKRSVSFRCSNTHLRNLSNTAWAFAKVQIKRRSVVLHVDSCGSGVELGAFAIFCLAFADMICLWLGMPCLVSLCFTMFHWNLWICIDSIDFLEWHYIIYYNIIYIYIINSYQFRSIYRFLIRKIPRAEGLQRPGLGRPEMMSAISQSVQRLGKMPAQGVANTVGLLVSPGGPRPGMVEIGDVQYAYILWFYDILCFGMDWKQLYVCTHTHTHIYIYII